MSENKIKIVELVRERRRFFLSFFTDHGAGLSFLTGGWTVLGYKDLGKYRISTGEGWTLSKYYILICLPPLRLRETTQLKPSQRVFYNYL